MLLVSPAHRLALSAGFRARAFGQPLRATAVSL